MKLTGECKKAFEKWLSNQFETMLEIHCDYNGTFMPYNIDHFNFLPPSMQYGVLVDFFDSVGVKVIDDYDINMKEYFVWVMEDLKDARTLLGLDYDTQYYKTRQEARTAAIIKANEILNKG